MENDKAIAAYAAHIDTVRMRLESLTAWAEEFGYVSPDRVQWPNVGSAGHVAELLGQVCEFLGVDDTSNELQAALDAIDYDGILNKNLPDKAESKYDYWNRCQAQLCKAS